MTKRATVYLILSIVAAITLLATAVSYWRGRWTAALKHEDAAVRAAARSLSLIGLDAALAVREALADDNALVRAGAARAIVDAFAHKDDPPWPSKQATTIVPALSALLNDSDPTVQSHAKTALEYLRR
jgi:HEAT repeat protein